MSEYRDLEIFEGAIVEVYRDGRIKTKDSTTVRANGRPLNRKGKFLEGVIDEYGYRRVGVMVEGKRKHFYVHRLVSMAWIPNPEGKPTVNHKDGIKLNNEVSNLEWATHAEQKAHALITGLADKNVKALAESNRRISRKVEFNGTVYPSIREASRKEGVDRNVIKRKGVML